MLLQIFWILILYRVDEVVGGMGTDGTLTLPPLEGGVNVTHTPIKLLQTRKIRKIEKWGRKKTTWDAKCLLHVDTDGQTTHLSVCTLFNK